MVYGYARISTPSQSIDRQIRNLKEYADDIVILQESHTGTDFQGCKELQKLIKKVAPGDSIIFDSVSRMSRDAAEGFKLYKELYQKGVKLVFLKEPHINSTVYETALKRQNIALTGTNVDFILEGLNKYLLSLAEEQIKIAFEQSEKEVLDLKQRTREGMFTAKLLGKQVGQVEGAKLNTKKSIEAKRLIQTYSKDFGGSLSDIPLIKLCGCSRKSFYKYKKELRESS